MDTQMDRALRQAGRTYKPIGDARNGSRLSNTLTVFTSVYLSINRRSLQKDISNVS